MESRPAPRMRRRNAAPRGRSDHMVPLSLLLSRELELERIERPVIRYGVATQPKKGEDYALVKTDCQRIPGDGSTTFAIFSVLDGHNGAAAAIFTKENLFHDVMGAMPPNLSREEWLVMLPRALVAGFVKTDKEFQTKERSSGTTVTFVVVDQWTVTVASVGDSRCILDSQGGAVSTLTVDHRLEENEEERDRVTASGGEVGRLSTLGGAEIGPLRCWPGGLCLSRSIGDMDVGEFIVPIPHVKQVKVSSAGGRLIIASDGVWDAISCEVAANCCRGLPAELAAKQIVKEALCIRGLQDDTTCLVVDLMPPKSSVPMLPAAKKRSKLKSLIFGKRPEASIEKLPDRFAEVGVVEELFEQGSAVLAERLGSAVSMSAASDLFQCAICQIGLSPSEGISVHAGSFFSMNARPWEGPFLCMSCKLKKDAMEGKRPARGVSVA